MTKTKNFKTPDVLNWFDKDTEYHTKHSYGERLCENSDYRLQVEFGVIKFTVFIDLKTCQTPGVWSFSHNLRP